MTAKNRDAAIAWVEAGFAVFPADPVNKMPVQTNAYYQAPSGKLLPARYRWSTDSVRTRPEVERLWDDYPNAMPGLATGAINGFSVLDFDRKAHETTEQANARLNQLLTLLAEHGVTSGFGYVLTPKGGLHIWFRHVEGVTNARGDLMPQWVDVRGHGGYVIAPGAVNEEGRAYKWVEGKEGWAKLAEVRATRCACLPAFPLALVRRAKIEETSAPPSEPLDELDEGQRAWAETALEKCLDEVRTAPEGTRNNTLNGAAYRLGTIIGGGLLDFDRVHAALLAAALACGLDEHEAERTMGSGLKAGMAKPNTGPARYKVSAEQWAWAMEWVDKALDEKLAKDRAKWQESLTQARAETAEMLAAAKSEAKQTADEDNLDDDDADDEDAKAQTWDQPKLAEIFEIKTSPIPSDEPKQALVVRPLRKSQYLKAMPKKPEPFPLRQPDKDLPGLTGALCRYFARNVHRESAVASVAGALSIMSILLGQGYELQGGMRANLYIALIGRSGSGKTNIINAAKELLAEIGAEKMIGPEEYKSGSAISKELTENPVQLAMIDEFGHKLQQVTSIKAPTHLKETLSSWTKLHSASSSIYAGEAFAGREREMIYRPHLSILGCSTPQQFWAGLSSSALEDGTIARFLSFEIEEIFLREPDKTALHEVSQDCMTLRAKALANTGAGPAGGIIQTIPNAYTVPIEPAAADIRLELATYYARMSAYTEANNIMGAASIQNRVPEMADKIALILAVGCNFDHPSVSARIYALAARIATWSAALMFRSCERNMAENFFERDTQQILQIIERKGGTASMKHLANGIRRLDRASIQRAVDALVAREAIEITHGPRGGAIFSLAKKRRKTEKPPEAG